MISENIKNNINSFLGVTSASLCSTGIPLLGTENNQFSRHTLSEREKLKFKLKKLTTTRHFWNLKKNNSPQNTYLSVSNYYYANHNRSRIRKQCFRKRQSIGLAFAR